MAFYIKVKKETARRFVALPLRTNTADGCVLLWQADLNSVPGDTIQERAAAVGGLALTPNEAFEETSGVNNRPLPSDESGAGEGGTTVDTTPQTPHIPSVNVPADETGSPDETEGGDKGNTDSKKSGKEAKK